MQLFSNHVTTRIWLRSFLPTWNCTIHKMSSSSSSSASPEPAPPVVSKRKRKEVPIADSDDSASDSDNSDTESTPDELVLSHAERRRQKKAEKLKVKEEAASKKRKLKDGTAIPVPAGKRQNSVWVGNMSFKTTQDNLRTFFEGAGEIVRIYMPTKPAVNPAMKPENRGFAYVDFETAEAKAAAIARSEQPLIGRKLLIKDGDDFTGRPAPPGADSMATSAGTSTTHSKTAQKILRAQKQPPAPTLFLGNLGFETTEQAIRQLFEAHRTIKKKSKDEPDSDNEDGKQDKPKDVWIRKVRMGTFEDSGQCKGFAFVDFTSTEHATAALINPKNHHLNGRKLVVEYASAEAVRRGAPKVKREDGASNYVPPKRRDPLARGSRPEKPQGRQPQDSSRSRETADQMADFTPTVVTGAKYRQGDEPASNGIGRREKGPRVRPKPGAALALAKRESAAIVPSKGQKITF
ncbi:Nucleolar protein 13 [Hypsizygus marmoreus]|uniref:Nucleolar protein 13 n=1 Tax=Hypsizygus marmoreus TaxID=39966 RepID=A0A369JF65_HYPMA|nr:Nucleolar protein 13 [Hypsizygus marmoreus]